MLKFRHKISTVLISGFLIAALNASSIYAMCIWFVPPQRQFTPATNIQTLLVRDNNDNKLVVQPGFAGTATDFALVMPFPSQPELVEAPEAIFTELEELTNPPITFDDVVPLGAAENASTREKVEVIEVKNIGDYTATTLKADDAEALLDWLKVNGYEFTDSNLDTLNFYVENGTAYYVALKVNIDKANVDKDGYLEGNLRPLQFNFSSDSPTLPLRLMQGNGPLVTLTVYTLARNILYIPGAEVQFSRKITATDIKDHPSFEDYDMRGRWLVRNVVQFDPVEVKSDTDLLTTRQSVVIDAGDRSVVLNPDKLSGDTGLLVSERGEVIYTDEDAKLGILEQDVKTSPTSLWIVTVILGVSNIVLLALLGKDKSD
jgi:hypothetical protein